MAKEETHIQASRSWWSGRITALCGRTWEDGQWEHTWFASVSCKDCKRIDKEGRR